MPDRFTQVTPREVFPIGCAVRPFIIISYGPI
jgi:hypothetical protein